MVMVDLIVGAGPIGDSETGWTLSRWYRAQRPAERRVLATTVQPQAQVTFQDFVGI
jgi:hypothetical protein